MHRDALRSTRARPGAALVLHAALGAALLLPPLAAAPPSGGGSADEATRSVARLLGPDAPAQVRREPGALGAELRELGSPALPALFAALALGRAPAAEPDEPPGDPLSPRAQGAVRDALLAAPRPALRALLHGLDRHGVETRELAAALDLAARFAGEEDVGWICDLARRGSASRAVRRGLRDALAGAYARDPRTLRTFLSVYSRLPPELLAPTLEATRAAGANAAVTELARALGVVGEADALVLVEMGRRAHEAIKPVDLGVLGAVRPYLRSAHANEAGAAVQVLGALEDSDSALGIVACMETRPGLRSTCNAALVQLTGQRLGDEPRLWRALVEAEEAWWRDRARLALRDLRALPPAEFNATVLELARHRLFRHELAPHLAAALDRPEPDLVRLGCSALGHLGSRAALGPLIVELGHPDARVRAAAHQALARISGRDHGQDPAAWREAEL